VILITGGGGAYCRLLLLLVCGAPNGGNGGSVTVQPGIGGKGLAGSGHSGYVLLAPTGGNVGIGEANPAHTLEVTVGGTTLADAWVTRSSRRIKTNIQPLHGALEKIERLQGVSYERKDDGRHEIGVVAEDVDQIVPEVVAHDPKTREVEGVDYSRLVALLIEAVKSQQGEIEQLKARVEQLTSNISGR
jgi:Chaperone of endosialidase